MTEEQVIHLAIPLKQSQLAAANQLYTKLRGWQQSEAALDSLKDHYPDFGGLATRVKAVAVNAMYGTNVFAIARLSERISRILVPTDLTQVGPNLVERLAILPSQDSRQQTRRFVSFASKFAHFFIDSERFPICDSYAAAMLKFHLRGTTCTQAGTPCYPEFVANFLTLRNTANLACTTRELDRYLWLAGLYRHYLRGNEKINVEVRDLFGSALKKVRADLRRLLPKSCKATARSRR